MAKDPIKSLVDELKRLPGIGERTALRLALHILEEKKERIRNLAQSLVDVAENVVECEICCNLATDAKCTVCIKPGRDASLICVVSSIQDLMAIETTHSFFGLYHVLHGVLAPMNGIGPSKLRIASLMNRIKKSTIKELILAVPATVEGEATALYIKELIDNSVIKISRIASGVPVGGDLQFADRLSVSRALMMRHCAF